MFLELFGGISTITSHGANPKNILGAKDSSRTALDPKNIPGPKEPDSKFRQLEK